MDYYQKLWNILNEGDGEKWENLTKIRKQEVDISLYRYDNDNNEDINKIKERKNRMAPLEDYRMKIYGNGKLVLRETHTKELNGKNIDVKNESPLIRNGKTKGVSFYPVKLYLPIENNDFVIIRH
ncbi:hypothetical protein NZ698_19100 [Chryseobacterium sp. PBS4-4]|uniref:Uncharacterized protein n=1 Tax=Chryseobacterium edaphi TaxID=2976532 RepID=A0ABT2WAQ2_9FLAO|nr:hypothetical protein [Chryseobacterium edaphi]MCU7619293.1 hypothetical protein [Chryseobacterium edaphi]